MSTDKKKVLVMADWFAPGFKAGGPIRSCVNFAEHLKEDLDIYVFTSDRDLNESVPYKSIDKDKWIGEGSGFKVYYASPGSLSFFGIRKMIETLRPDVIYLNSMFSRKFSLYPILLSTVAGVKARMILAPRGMLKDSAVEFKKKKKKFFLKFFKLLGFHRHLEFHCTDETELSDVHKYFGNVSVKVLPNLPGVQKSLVFPDKSNSGELRLLFVGRIHPIKNLELLLDVLKETEATIHLNIVATVENERYWERCKQLINELPPNIRVDYQGERPHHEVENLLLANHVFVLPTSGENFGHAIFEALSAGRPVVISDQTPWRNLAQFKAGWDLSLQKKESFREVIERFAKMEQREFNEWCAGAWQFARQYIERSGNKNRYLEFFG